MPPLAVVGLLTSAVFVAFAAAGMTDVPVAAACAATAVVLWSRLSPAALVVLAALAAAATVLAKPSGLLALVGLALATAVLRGRAALPGLGGAAIGVCLGIAYDAWQAARLDAGLAALLRAGNDSFWLERGAAARFDTIAGAAWMGAGARLLVTYGLAHGLARALGGGSRVSLGVGVAAAVVWSTAGPVAAGDGIDYPFDGSALGIVAWLVLVAALVAAPLLARLDPTPRRIHVALLAWLAPVALVWATQRPDEPRLLAPAWPAFALLTAAALTSASVALLRYRPLAALVPAVAVAAIAFANVVSVDGLGRDGWRSLLDLGPSGWGDRAEMENFAYGPFSYQLDLARENVREGRSHRLERRAAPVLLPGPGRSPVRTAMWRAHRRAVLLVPLLGREPRVRAAPESADQLAELGPVRPAPARARRRAGRDLRGVRRWRTPGPRAHGGGLPHRSHGRRAERRRVRERPRLRRRRASSFGGLSRWASRAHASNEPDASDSAWSSRGFRTIRRSSDEFRQETQSVGLDVSYEPAVRYAEVPPGITPVPP